jgi:excisionase family DNA binding protein
VLKKLLQAREVADILGLNLQYVYDLMRTNRIPAVRVGRRVRVDPDVLQEWIRNGGSIKPKAAIVRMDCH